MNVLKTVIIDFCCYDRNYKQYMKQIIDFLDFTQKINPKSDSFCRIEFFVLNEIFAKYLFELIK